MLAFLKAGGKTLLTVQTDIADGNDHMYDQKITLDVKYNKPNKLSKKELSDKLRNISERSSAFSDDDSVAMQQRQELVSEIEEILSARSDDLDEEEQDLYSSLEDLLLILK